MPIARSHADPLDILYKYWGYDSFRPQQAEIIDNFLAGHDTVGLLPTGGGKSITFQVPALALDEGLTIVVSPLISLMKDQVDNLRAIGVRAMSIYTGLTRREVRLCYDRAALGKLRLLYIAPERLKSEAFLNEMRRWDVAQIVVDEAHCISQWGHDFRPSYLEIATIRDMFPDAPVLALTASATPEVLADICTQLRLDSPKVFRRSFSRDNISYVVRRCDNKADQLAHILSRTSGTAIVYTRSRRRTRELAEHLCACGISASFYHAGLGPEDKALRQERWKDDQVRVMVATNAFGMGIDKPDVRVVIHHDLPSSIEEYYQEAGRAGRDGKPSYAIALVSSKDGSILTRRLNDSFPPREYIRQVYDNLCVWFNIAMGEGADALHEFHLEQFCQRWHLMPAPANAALNLLARSGHIDYAEEADIRARVMILVTKSQLYDLRLSRTADAVLQHLLRSYTGLFSDYVFIDEGAIATQLRLPQIAVHDALLEMGRMRILHYIPRITNPLVSLCHRREESRHITISREVYEVRRDQLKQRIEAVRRFAFNNQTCRVRTILEYFGEKPDHDCGTCDVCRDRRSAQNARSHAERAKEYLLSACASPGYDVAAVIAASPAPRLITIECYRRLLDEGSIC